MAAVGWAKKIVLPLIPFCCTSGTPLPRRTCFQQHRPKEANILVALDASRTCTFSRPIQLSFVSPFNGNFGFLAHKSFRQSQHAHT